MFCTNNQILIIFQKLRYMNRTFVSKLIYDVINNNDFETRRNIRTSSRVFTKISSLLPNKRHGWEIELELTVFLFWLASGVSYRVVSCATNIPRSTVHHIVHKLLNFTVTKLLPAAIKFPNASEFEAIGRKFNRRGKTNIFENAVGAIDGTHTRIQCPIKLHDQYVNRKCSYSIQCQAVCDSNMKFLNIFVGFPGSVHDTRVLYNSSLFKEAKFPPNGYFILGDSGYPCRMHPICIVTPFKDTGHFITEEQRKFNDVHSKSRTIIECAFGQVKNRWRSIFNKDLELKIETIVKTVTACFVFHNICMDMNDFVIAREGETDEDIGNNNSIIVVDDGEGSRFRDQLLSRLRQDR